MKERIQHILKELQQHLPYTIFSVASGLIVLGFLTVLIEPAKFHQAANKLFHIFHPLHLFFSTIVTTAMFWRYERKMAKSILVGFVGSVGICGISDIIIPYLAGILLSFRMELHICIIEHYSLILPFVLFGILTGLILPAMLQSTLFPHTGHVLISSMASILYLVSFGLIDWTSVAGMVFIYIVLAVVIPCCSSDIVFPLLLAKKTRPVV